MRRTKKEWRVLVNDVGLEIKKIWKGENEGEAKMNNVLLECIAKQ